MSFTGFSDEQLNEVLAQAQERAATQVENWIPEEKGDNVAGIIEEIADITTDYGTVPVTVHRVRGHSKYPDGMLIRVAWMGAVLKAKWDKFQPEIGDLCAFHYQEDVEPKQRGFKAYKLIESVVIDHRTHKAKLPVNANVRVPTRQELENVDPETGELPPPMTADELRERFGANVATEGPRPGETAF